MILYYETVLDEQPTTIHLHKHCHIYSSETPLSHITDWLLDVIRQATPIYTCTPTLVPLPPPKYVKYYFN